MISSQNASNAGSVERPPLAMVVWPGTRGTARPRPVRARLGDVQVKDPEKIVFLQKDFYDSLRWLFVGAVAWEADKTKPRIKHQAVLGMYTAAVQARALYEFFYAPSHADDARAADLVAGGWSPAKSQLYSTYMARGKPANKRMFHLVYQRDRHSGGTGHDGPDHLKNQIVNFAIDLLALSRDFVNALGPTLQPYGQHALNRALNEAAKVAAEYGIANPMA